MFKKLGAALVSLIVSALGSRPEPAPETKPGDHVVLQALMDLHVVVSACPQDMNLTCGGRPTDILLEICDPD